MDVRDETELLKIYKPLLRIRVAKLLSRIPITAMITRDDLMSVASFALIHFWRRHGHEIVEEENFLRAATFRIRGALLDYVRSVDPLSKSHRAEGAGVDIVSFESLRTDEAERVMGAIWNRENFWLEADEDPRKTFFLEWVNGLGERDQRIIAGILNGREQKDIANEHGVTEGRISQILTQIKRCCRAAYAEKNLLP